MKATTTTITIIILFFSIGYSNAQEIVYKPINPSFLGGNSFNANWLLNQANTQSTFKEESPQREVKTELERFTESLNRQLLNQLSRNLFQDEFGTDGLEEGTFTFGSLVVDISDTSDGRSFSIFDTTSGEQTVIIIP
ncbi:MAG: curli production assembly/transport component CsgF [Flavobacteriaceae bacterium]